MLANPKLVAFLLAHPEVLIQVDFAKEIWMIPERLIVSYQLDNKDIGGLVIHTDAPLYKGKFVVCPEHSKNFLAIDEFIRIYPPGRDIKTYTCTKFIDTGIEYNPKETTPLCTPQDSFTLKAGDIVNYPKGPDLDTTIGIFAANYMLLVYPFDDVIPYHNDEFTTSKLEKMIALPLIDDKIDVRRFKDRYVNTLSLFGGSNEIFCPNISEKTIVVPKEIETLRNKLIKDNAEALAAGDTTVMSDIEKQLIAKYKEHLKGDPSMHFLLKSKYFNVTLKKLFLTQGMTEKFDAPGQFDFVSNPMGDGWKIKDLPVIFNEVRKGSYARAIETADGGVIAKLILRVFQDTRIMIDDCGTTRGEVVDTHFGNLSEFLWNYAIVSDGSNVLITDENKSSFENRTIVVRTPGYCQASPGFCAKCFGKLFEEIGQKAFAPMATDFSKTITTSALKAMHGVSHSTVDVSDLNHYLVTV